MSPNHQLLNVGLCVVLLFQSSAACAAAAPAKGRPSASPTSAPAAEELPSDPAFPIQPDVAKSIANSPFFKLPAGNYAPFERHKVTPGRSPVDEQMSVARVTGSPLCRNSKKHILGKERDTTSDEGRLTWAGLIPLYQHKDYVTRFTITTSAQTTQIDKLSGQPFPLKSGSIFGWEVTYPYENTQKFDGHQEVDKDTVVEQFSCQVGATGPASVIQDGLQGSETEVVCIRKWAYLVDRDFGNDSYQFSYHWIDSVGCFVQTEDPKPIKAE